MAKVIKAAEMTQDTDSRLAVMKLQELAVEAKEVVMDARRQAAEILAEARKQADVLAREAEKKGYALGYERGRQEGAAQGEREAYQKVYDERTEIVQDLTGGVRRILDSLASKNEQSNSSQERKVVRFALHLAERIVGEIAAKDIHSAEINIAKALKLVGSRERVIVRVNSGQLDRIRNQMSEVASLLEGSGKVELVGDPSIAPGGAKVETNEGLIDATIETQFNKAVEMLLGSPDHAVSEGRYCPEGAYERA